VPGRRLTRRAAPQGATFKVYFPRVDEPAQSDFRVKPPHRLFNIAHSFREARSQTLLAAL